MLDARVDQDHISELYRRIAPGYDFWARMTESRARDCCLEFAAIEDGESVLEVAVGTGLAFEQILKSNPSGRNEGIDLTAEMLARAKRRAAATGIENYRLTAGDAHALAFPDGEFDVLINNYMFDLLPEDDMRTVLAEFRRVLRPGGRLALASMTRGKRWYNKLWERIYQVNPSWLGGCRGIEVAALLEPGDFVLSKRHYISQSTFPSEVVCAVAV